MNRIPFQLFEGVQIFRDVASGYYYVQGRSIPFECAANARLYISLFMAPNTFIAEDLPTLN